MAERQGFELLQSFAFPPSDFAGYETRRHQNDKSFGSRIGQSRCYRFARREEAGAAAAVESVVLRALTIYREEGAQKPKRQAKRRKTRVCQLTEGRYMSAAEGLFECLECHGKFKSEQGVRTHVYMQHVLDSAAEETVTCDLCSRIFAHRKALLEHRKIVHELGTPKKSADSFFPTDLSLVFGCCICDLRFPTTLELQRHLDGICPSEDLVELACADCDRRFHEERALIQHRNIAHPPDKGDRAFPTDV